MLHIWWNNIKNETDETCNQIYRYFNFQLCIYNLSSAMHKNATTNPHVTFESALRHKCPLDLMCEINFHRRNVASIEDRTRHREISRFQCWANRGTNKFKQIQKAKTHGGGKGGFSNCMTCFSSDEKCPSKLLRTVSLSDDENKCNDSFRTAVYTRKGRVIARYPKQIRFGKSWSNNVKRNPWKQK